MKVVQLVDLTACSESFDNKGLVFYLKQSILGPQNTNLFPKYNFKDF